MEALDAYELKVNPGKVKNAEEDKADEDKEDEDEGAFLIPADVPADNEDSIDEEEEEEDEEHKEEHEEEEEEQQQQDEQQQDEQQEENKNPAMDEPVTTLAELVLVVPSENIVTELIFDPAHPEHSY